MVSMHTIRRSVVLLAVMAAVLTTTALASAQDRIHLRDGSVVEGRITQELDGYIFFVERIGSAERDRYFRPNEYVRVERDVDAESGDADASREARTRDRQRDEPRRRESSSGTRAAILTLGGREGDMVGLYMAAKPLKDAIEHLERKNVDVVVFLIYTDGGMLLEVPRLIDLIEEEYKPRFRTVAWIEKAISAGAMTSHAIEEIYFMPGATYGAATAFSGASMEPVEGRELERALFLMEEVSNRNARSPYIMRAMQILEPLSADIDEETGQVTWRQDDEGEIMVSPEDSILTLTSDMAERLKFSRGTAATKEELAELMGLGEVEWIGDRVRGERFPISRAEEIQRRWRQDVQLTERRLGEWMTSYRQAIGNAQSENDRQIRGRFVNLARQHLNRIDRMIRNNMNFAFFIGIHPDQFREWVEEQQQMLRDLMR